MAVWRRLQQRLTAQPVGRGGSTVLLRFAFATDRHARQALAVLRTRTDLFRRAVPLPTTSPETEFSYVEFEVDAERVDRAMALASGLHAVPVGRPPGTGQESSIA